MEILAENSNDRSCREKDQKHNRQFLLKSEMYPRNKLKRKSFSRRVYKFSVNVQTRLSFEKR